MVAKKASTEEFPPIGHDIIGILLQIGQLGRPLGFKSLRIEDRRQHRITEQLNRPDGVRRQNLERESECIVAAE
jgi:hypothetical protein